MMAEDIGGQQEYALFQLLFIQWKMTVFSLETAA
jgi:hypothetical protein